MDKTRFRGGMSGALSILLAVGCGSGGSPPAANDYPTLVVQRSDVTQSVSHSAAIRGRRDIGLYSQVSGKITEVRVSEGQTVKKGQVLFVVDQVPYRAELRVAEANYSAAQVGLESARLNYDSSRELFDNGVVSSHELQIALNALHTAEAALAQADANRVNAVNNLSYTEIKSPSDGVVGTLPFREGTLVSPTMAESLTTVSDNSEVYVYFSINENSLLEMSRRYGTAANAIARMPDVLLRLSDGTLYEPSGRIESISGVISESTGTASLRAVFPNPDGLLRSGANGSVVVPENYTGVILIPQEATFELQDKVFVYKVVDGVARLSAVAVTGTGDGRQYIVTEGLDAGDEIVASGAGLLRDGARVKNTENRAGDERK